MAKRNSQTGQPKTYLTSVKLSPRAMALLSEISDLSGRSRNASMEDGILVLAEKLGLYKKEMSV